MEYYGSHLIKPMINKKDIKPMYIYTRTAVNRGMKKAAKDHKTSASSLGAEIMTEWLVKNKYLKTKSVRIVEMN